MKNIFDFECCGTILLLTSRALFADMIQMELLTCTMCGNVIMNISPLTLQCVVQRSTAGEE